MCTGRETYFILRREKVDAFHLAGGLQQHFTEAQEVVQLRRREEVRVFLCMSNTETLLDHLDEKKMGKSLQLEK